MSVELEPGPSQIVGARRIAKRFGKGERWARRLLKEWYEDQQRGGPVRVLVQRAPGGQLGHYTTVAVLDQHAPPGRDERLVRAVGQIDKDVDALARKVNKLLDENRALARRVAELEKRR